VFMTIIDKIICRRPYSRSLGIPLVPTRGRVAPIFSVKQIIGESVGGKLIARRPIADRTNPSNGLSTLPCGVSLYLTQESQLAQHKQKQKHLVLEPMSA